MKLKVKDIIDALEAVAPSTLQESWDNTGLLVGSPAQEVSGVMLCVDVTPEIVEEAQESGANMIVSHHPLIFRGLKRLNGNGRVEQSVIKAIEAGIAIYCCHTSIDSAPAEGVSHRMAKMLGVERTEVLAPSSTDSTAGLGVIGELPRPLTPIELVERVKREFGSPVARCSVPPVEVLISRVAMCGGSGSEFLDPAIAQGAQAMITSDTRYHDFCDYGRQIFIVDIGHFESEYCTKQIFYDIISEKFPNFAVYKSELEYNPISYL